MKGSGIIGRFFGAPVVRFVASYAFVTASLGFSVRAYLQYRPLSNPLFIGFMALGSGLAWLWLLFFLDEVIFISGRFPKVEKAVRIAKYIALRGVVVIGLTGLFMISNALTMKERTFWTGRIEKVSTLKFGYYDLVYYVIEPEASPGAKRYVLATNKDWTYIYAGSDVMVQQNNTSYNIPVVGSVRIDPKKTAEKVMKIAPGSTSALYMLAQAYMERNEFDNALKAYELFVARNPDDVYGGIALASACVISGEFAHAARLLPRLVQLRPDEETLYLWGYTLAYLGRKEEAALTLLAATEVDPKSVRSFYSLGYVFRDLGDREKARKAWERVLELQPVYPEIRSNIDALGNN